MKRRDAFTLIEVVAALVLMGSVLAGSLLAFSRHRRQLDVAEKRLEATVVADQLISELSALEDGIPNQSRGRIAGKPNWFWQTAPVGTTMIASVPMQVIRLQIIDLTAESSGDARSDLVSVEFVKGVPAR